MMTETNNTITTETLRKWQESAAAAGDAETHLIACIALGEDVDFDAGWAIPAEQIARLRNLSVAEARRLASGW